MYICVLFEKGNELETFALVFESTTSVLKKREKKGWFPRASDLDCRFKPYLDLTYMTINILPINFFLNRGFCSMKSPPSILCHAANTVGHIVFLDAEGKEP